MGGIRPGRDGRGLGYGPDGTGHLPDAGKSADLRDRAAWPASGPGREFIAGSSRRWRDADVAAGTDEAAAQAAADRTVAAYTGGGASG